MARITTLLFDVGGTLVFPSWQRISDELAREGIEIAPELLAAREPHARHAIDQTTLAGRTRDPDQWGAYFDRIARACGALGIPAAALARLRAYNEAHNLWEHVSPEVPRVLEALRAHYRLGVVSNADGSVPRKLAQLGLADAFDAIVDSGAEGIEKPDPRIFELALVRMGARADETAYVGDIYHVDVIGARAARLVPILLDPCELHTDKDCHRVRALEELLPMLALLPSAL